MRIASRVLAVVSGLVLFLLGAIALGLTYLPDHDVPRVAGRLVIRLGAVVLGPLDLSKDPRQLVAAALSGFEMRFLATPAGLILIMAGLLRGTPKVSVQELGDTETLAPEVDAGTRRKAARHAAGLARRGNLLEAAEHCFDSGLMDQAADYFIRAEKLVRAAEIRHDQHRFTESAELYMQAGLFEAAGRIFSQQDEHEQAAEAYRRAENHGIAAELFEKAGNHRTAAECFEESGLPRQAAQNYVKCELWEKAAVCLEQSIIEETTATGMSENSTSAPVQKLVRMAGNLFERAELDDRAEAVLVRGGCFVEAAEIALRGGRDENAVEYFLKASDVPRAAEVMCKLGQDVEAARVLAEHHRNLDDHEEAARCYERAGELLAAGDIYRMLEQYDRAGECYERFGDSEQAAEMFSMAGDRRRAASNYEQAGLYAEAAECASMEGDENKQAELLAQAGSYLRAGEIHMRAGRPDDAIAALQQVSSEHTDAAAASAILGDIFRERGQHTLAITKLRHATDGKEIGAENIQAFYGLAAALEANGDIAEADGLYERILSFDYGFKDVQQRLDATREKLAQKELDEKALEKKVDAAGASETPPMTKTAQQGRYKIIGKLGRGGMGVVYKATDTVLDRTVAFKVLPSALRDNPQALKNFLREAKSAAKLNHPGIVTVYDAGEQDGVFYIAMEHVDGSTLKDIVKHRGKISPGGIVHVLAQMCEALAYAHDNKVVHRDIKTANTMWTRDRKAKIMDFGLAKAIEEVRNHTTVVSGTPYYMSPEQTLGKNVDHRTDIYSLGITIFELATGTLPFREGNLPYHHVHTPPPDAREFNAELPPLIAGIIARCLEKDPADRYQSASEIVAELKAALEKTAKTADTA
jgi:tetratricopeptide (TPR) repeat protein